MENKLIELSTHLGTSSPFYLGNNIGAELKKALDGINFDNIFIVTDNNVNTLYGKDLVDSIGRKNCKVIMISGNERDKTVNTLIELCENLLEQGITKGSLLIAFGGGVVGNIVGLAASLIYRGIKFVEIPTTFMAQTDGTLSNKQAVNGKSNKNLFGCYYAPCFIWADSKYVLSESVCRIKCSLVETVKNGFIHDKSVLSSVDQYLAGNLKDNNALHEIIYKSILSKLEIIKIDPSEKGYGMVLEYGHTFGHAIERLSNGQKSHGECVAIGMLIAAQLSYNLGLLSLSALETHDLYLNKKMKLNISIPSYITLNKIMEAIEYDNKKTEKGVRFVLLEDINVIHNPEGDFMVKVDPVIVEKTIGDYIEKYKEIEFKYIEEPEYADYSSLRLQ